MNESKKCVICKNQEASKGTNLCAYCLMSSGQ